jgi:hypothetical protein
VGYICNIVNKDTVLFKILFRLFSKRLLLLRLLNLKTEVDYNGRCETPVGIAGRLRPRRSDSDEEAQLTPHGKGASWSCNQLT